MEQKAPCMPCAQARLRRLAELTAKAQAELDAARDALTAATVLPGRLPLVAADPRVLTQ